MTQPESLARMTMDSDTARRTHLHNIRRRGAWLGLLMVTVAMAAACGSSTELKGPVSIALVGPTGEKELTVARSGSVRLEATAKDAAGGTLINASYTFASRNNLVAMVDGAGMVTGIAGGIAFIVASIPSNGRQLSDSVLVVVAVPVQGPIGAGDAGVSQRP